MSIKRSDSASAETHDGGTDGESGGAVPFVLDEGSELGEVVLGAHPEDPIQSSECLKTSHPKLSLAPCASSEKPYSAGREWNVPLPVPNNRPIQTDMSSSQKVHAKRDISGTSAARSENLNSSNSSKDELTYAEQSVTDTDSEVDWLSTELARRDELIEQLSEYVYKLWNANDSLFADYESQETALTDRLRVLRARLHDATQTLRQSSRKEGAPPPRDSVPLELIQTIKELAQGINYRLALLSSSSMSHESKELKQSAIELLSSLNSCKVDQVDAMCRRFFHAIIAVFEIGPHSSTYELEEKARQSEQEVARLSSLVRELQSKLESVKGTFPVETVDSANASVRGTPVCNNSFSFSGSPSLFPARSDAENPAQPATEPASSHPCISHTRPECYVEVESWTGEPIFDTSVVNGAATHNINHEESLTVFEAESNSIAVIPNQSPLTERSSVKLSKSYVNHDGFADILQQPEYIDYDALSSTTCHQPRELSSDHSEAAHLTSGSGKTIAPMSTSESALVLRPILKRPASLPRVSANKSKISWYDELDSVCDRLWNVMDRLQQAVSIKISPVSEDEKSPGLGSVTSRLESLVQLICDVLENSTQVKLPESEERNEVAAESFALTPPLDPHRLMVAQKIRQDVRALRADQTELFSQVNYCFSWMKDQLRYVNQSLLMLPGNVNASSDIMHPVEQGVQGSKDQSPLCNAVYPPFTVSKGLNWLSGDSVSVLANGLIGTDILVDKCVGDENETQHLDSIILNLRSENGSLQAQLNAANSEIDTLTSYLMKVKREVVKALPTEELNWFHDRPESLEFQVIPEMVCRYVRWSQNSLEAYSTQLERNNAGYTQLQRELDAAHNQLGSVQHTYRALDARYLRTAAELSSLKKQYRRQVERFRGGVLTPNAHTDVRLHDSLRPDSTASVVQSTPERSELGGIECEMASHYNGSSESPKNKFYSSIDSLLLTTTNEHGSGWHKQQIAEHRPNRWSDLDDVVHDTDPHTHPMCSWPQSDLSAPVQRALAETSESTTTTNTDELLTKLEHKEQQLKAIKQELDLMSQANVELRMQVQVLTDEAAKLQFVKQQLQISEQNKLDLQQHVQTLRGLLTQQLSRQTTAQNSMLSADLGELNYNMDQVAQLAQANKSPEQNPYSRQLTETVEFEPFTQQWVLRQEAAQERLQSLEQECQCLREVNTRLQRELKSSQEQLAHSHNEYTKLQFDFANLQIAYQTTRNQLEEYTVTLTQHLESLRSRNVTVDKQVFTDGLYPTTSSESFPNDLSATQHHHCAYRCSELAMSNDMLSRQLKDAFDQLSIRLEALGHRDKQLADLRLVLHERDEELSCLKRELKLREVELQAPSNLLTEATNVFYPDVAGPQASLPQLLARVETSEPTPNESDELLRRIEAAEQDRDRFIQAFQQSEATVHTLRTTLTQLATEPNTKTKREVQVCTENVGLHGETPGVLVAIETPPIQKTCTLSATSEFMRELNIAEPRVYEADISEKSLHASVESIRMNLEDLQPSGDIDDRSRASVRLPSDIASDVQKQDTQLLTTEQNIFAAKLPAQQFASFNHVDVCSVPRTLYLSKRVHHERKSTLFTARSRSVTDFGYEYDRPSWKRHNLPGMQNIMTAVSLNDINMQTDDLPSYCYAPVDQVVDEVGDNLHAPRRFSEGNVIIDQHASVLTAQFSSAKVREDRFCATLAEGDSELRHLKYLLAIKLAEVHELQQSIEKFKSSRHVINSSSMTEFSLVSLSMAPLLNLIQDGAEAKTKAAAEVKDSLLGALDNRGSCEALCTDSRDELKEKASEPRPFVENSKVASTPTGWSESQDYTVNKSQVDSVTQQISSLNRDVSNIFLSVMPLLDELKAHDVDVPKMRTAMVGEVTVGATSDGACGILHKANRELFLLNEKITHLSHCFLTLVQLCHIRLREWSNKCDFLERQVSMLNDEKVLLQRTLDAAISPPVRYPISRVYDSKSGVNPVLACNEPDDVIQMPSICRSWNIDEAPVPPKHLRCALSQLREHQNQWAGLFEDRSTEYGKESQLDHTAVANVLDASLQTDEHTDNHRMNDRLIRNEPTGHITDLPPEQVGRAFDVGTFLHQNGSGRIRQDNASYPSGCRVDNATHLLESEPERKGNLHQSAGEHTENPKQIEAFGTTLKSETKDGNVSLQVPQRPIITEFLEADDATSPTHQLKQRELMSGEKWDADKQKLKIYAGPNVTSAENTSETEEDAEGRNTGTQNCQIKAEKHSVIKEWMTVKLQQIEKQKTTCTNVECVTQIVPPKAPKHLLERGKENKAKADCANSAEIIRRIIRNQTKETTDNHKKEEGRKEIKKSRIPKEEVSKVDKRLLAALEKMEVLECENRELQLELLSRSQLADRGRLLDETLVDLVDAKRLLGELLGQLAEVRVSYVDGLSERASLESTLRDALCKLSDAELELSVKRRHGEELRDALTESELACADARAAVSRQACELLELTDRLKCSELSREALSVRVADQQRVLVCMAGELRQVREMLCGVGAGLRTLGLECKRWHSFGVSELDQCVCTVDSLVDASQKWYNESASRLIEMELLVCELREKLRVACAPVCASEGALSEELCALRSEYARVCEAVATSEAMSAERSRALTAATDRVSELSAELSVVRQRVCELCSENEGLRVEIAAARAECEELRSHIDVGVRDGLIWPHGRVDVSSTEQADVSAEVCVARSVVCESVPCSSSTLARLPGSVCSDLDARADVSVVGEHESVSFSKCVEHVSSQTDEERVLDGSISYGTVIGVEARDAGVGPDMSDVCEVCEPKSALPVELDVDVDASIESSGGLGVLDMEVIGVRAPPPPPCLVQLGEGPSASSVEIGGRVGVCDVLTVDRDTWRAEVVSRDERICVLSQLVDARDAALRDSRYLLSEKECELVLLRQAQSRGEKLRAALESELERVKCELEAKCSELDAVSCRLLLLDESDKLGGDVCVSGDVSGRYEAVLGSGAAEDTAIGMVCKGASPEVYSISPSRTSTHQCLGYKIFTLYLNCKT